MLNHLEWYYKLGFSLHWLKPKSKAPLAARWSTGSKQKLETLVAAYKPGYNLGVRLGAMSEFPDGTFLAALDCDVKSEDEKHLNEMHEALDKIIPGGGSMSSPERAAVLSGRGNGSGHIYIRTRREFKGRMLACSSDKVRVMMPSTPPSGNDRKYLTAVEIDAGYRWRSAWEIVAMSAGRQIVLPPSIHPDSNEPYQWAGFLPHVTEDFPLFEKVEDLEQAPSVKTTIDPGSDIPETVSLDKLDTATQTMIMTGEGVVDRSAALLSVACKMYHAGYKTNEILSVLSDDFYALGMVGYDHGRTNRKSVIDWLLKYTMPKARESSDPEMQFDSVLGQDLDALTPALRNEQEKDLETLRSWREDIERSGPGPGARPKCSVRNIVLVLSNAVGKNLFVKNIFMNRITYGCNAPWGAKLGDKFGDSDAVIIMMWLANTWRFEPDKAKIYDAVCSIANANAIDPLRDYLVSLRWDGKERLNTWLRDYLGAKGPDKLLQVIGSKTIIAMAARGLSPGCKVDTVTIIEGQQGCGKSTAVSILGGDWFSDADLNIGDKDTVLGIQGRWVYEIGELTGMRKTEINALKAFITRQVDNVRLPYGRETIELPRRTVFIGTANPDDYLQDQTGNRRFWPVTVSHCDRDALSRDRDQLIAEAVFRYEVEGEKPFIDDPEILRLVTEEQSLRTAEDPWIEAITSHIAENPDFYKGYIKTKDLCDVNGPLHGTADGMDHKAQLRLGRALRACGFKKCHTEFGKRWVKSV